MTGPGLPGSGYASHSITMSPTRGGQFFGPGRFRETRGRVTEVRASAEPTDVVVGRRLWDAAQELTGVAYL